MGVKKNNGMSWSNQGSITLATITTLIHNNEQLEWYSNILPFGYFHHIHLFVPDYYKNIFLNLLGLLRQMSIINFIKQ